MKSHQNIRCTLNRCGSADGRVAAVRSTSGDSASFHELSSMLPDHKKRTRVSDVRGRKKTDSEWTYSNSLTICRFGCRKFVVRPFL